MAPLYRLFAGFLAVLLLPACIGDDIIDDYVQPQIRVMNPVTEIEAGTTYQFTAGFLNNVGMNEAITPSWSSSDESVLTVSQTGLATGLVEGEVALGVSYTDEFGETADRVYDLTVGASTVVVEEPMVRTGRPHFTTSPERSPSPNYLKKNPGISGLCSGTTTRRITACPVYTCT